MKILVWLLRLFILLVLVWFSVKNSEIVTLHAYPYSWQAPLVLVILAFFAGGVMLGLMASLGSIYRLKREIGGLNKEIRARQKADERADEKAAAAGPASQSSGIGNHGV
jgi:lipopolysaccharide assembly protein A